MIDLYTMAINIFEKFIKWNPELNKLMRDTTQAYDDNTPLPFHLENGVWTHTCLCFNHLLNNHSNRDYTLEDWMSMVISVLCHDIGKCYTKKINDEKKKTSFYGHGYASIQDTIDFIYYLRAEDIIYDDEEMDKILNLVLPAVANHIDMYSSPRNIELYLNNNYHLKLVATVLADCDSKGSITHANSKKKDGVDFTNIDVKPCKEVDDSLKNVHIFNGVPASGKDYLADQMGLPVLSFDDLRVDLYKKHLKREFLDKDSYTEYIETTSEATVYNEAWEWSIDSKIDIWKCMKDRVNNIKGDYVITCAYAKKGRRRIINSFGKANYYCHYVISDSDTIFDRDKRRDSKHLPDGVIKRFMRSQQIPTIREGFVKVKIISN